MSVSSGSLSPWSVLLYVIVALLGQYFCMVVCDCLSVVSISVWLAGGVGVHFKGTYSTREMSYFY